MTWKKVFFGRVVKTVKRKNTVFLTTSLLAEFQNVKYSFFYFDISILINICVCYHEEINTVPVRQRLAVFEVGWVPGVLQLKELWVWKIILYTPNK